MFLVANAEEADGKGQERGGDYQCEDELENDKSEEVREEV